MGELVRVADHIDAYNDTVRHVDEGDVDAAVGTLCDQTGAVLEVASTSLVGEPRRITRTVTLCG